METNLEIANKYQKWYYQLIYKAKLRNNLIGYTEVHHILPRSLGGDNSTTNLVALTAREHFVAHWLLSKMYDGLNKNKMLLALHGMQMKGTNKKQQRYESHITSRVYERTKKHVAEIMREKRTGTKASPETRAKLSQVRTGVVFSDERKEILSVAAKKREKNNPEKSNLRPGTPEELERLRQMKIGVARSDDTKMKISESLKEHFAINPKPPSSEETKRKQSIANIGKKQLEESKEKIRQAKLESIANGTHPSCIKYECEHCGVYVATMAFKRSHGDNCKYKGKNLSVDEKKEIRRKQEEESAYQTEFRAKQKAKKLLDKK